MSLCGKLSNFATGLRINRLNKGLNALKVADKKLDNQIGKTEKEVSDIFQNSDRLDENIRTSVRENC